MSDTKYAFPVLGDNGMTLRDYFAAHWLTGYIANTTTPDMSTGLCAEIAYKVADAMLKEREKDA